MLDLSFMSDPQRPILLVEDDHSVRDSLADLLRDQGYTIYMASTVREARELLHRYRPPVCLLDLNLPDGNGLEILREAARGRHPVRAVVMTAFPLQHLRPAEASALVAWLTKPVAPDVLLEAVQSAFDALAATQA